jgi:hypothetical protein
MAAPQANISREAWEARAICLAEEAIHHQHAKARWLHAERAYDRRYGVREACRRRDEGNGLPPEEDYLAQGRRAAAEEMLETRNPFLKVMASALLCHTCEGPARTGLVGGTVPGAR